ncbi:MAG: efflux RND transporter periplasmic adaptor subunit [Gammaproteobacteria bacterium]|nr:MAG: efflux RND transporter periplasmic adaptor subunit [Gammaproteobacteria bacterium]
MNSKSELLSQLRIDRNASSSRSIWPWIAGAAVLLLVIFVSYQLFSEAAPVPVKVQMARMATVDPASASVLDATGYVVARRQANVSSKVTGKVVEVLIEEGMTVEKNQIVARLEDINARKSFDVTKAELDAAKAQVVETRARVTEAKLNFDRNNLLMERQLVSQSAFDSARATHDSLRAQLKNREEMVNVSEKLLAQQKQNLDDYILRAPFTGVVIAKTSQPGEMISPISAGSGFTRTGICTLVDMTSLEIEVDVNESYIQRVHAGQLAEAMLEAYPEWKIPAKVAAIIPTADRQKATVKVRVAFENLDPRILPDMGVKVSFLNPEPAEKPKPKVPLGIRVPTTAVRSVDENKFIFVVKDGVLQQRKVKLNASYGSDVYISEGLSAGEDFVVEVSPQLKNGTKVIQE